MRVEQGEEKFEEASGYHSYPPPLATYEDVATSPALFMDTLKKLHLSMGTKFMIPIVGGKDLELHRLFVEVTSRGGIAKVLQDKKWKEVTAVFNFPSSATNASFILRKYYVSLIYHYEQIYLFKAKCWSPSPLDPITPKSLTAPPQVSGVIDGKFESGYLITVKIGCEELKGVLYQVPPPPPNSSSSSVALKAASCTPPRRKRRKKSEMRKRDPAHPKPNRSGYNFFFAEQHARLKPHYHGRDREISRIIGESWNKLQQPERRVYQEKALKDKERYKMEMEVYRERLRIPAGGGGLIYPSLPQVIKLTTDDDSTNVVFEDNDMSSDNYEQEKHPEEECSQLKNVNIEIMADDEAFDLKTRIDGGDKMIKLIAGNEIASTSNANVNESLPTL